MWTTPAPAGRYAAGVNGLWSGVLSTVDAVEAWIAEQSFWVQVPILLAVLIPLCFWLAGLVDRVVERILWPHARREARRLHPSAWHRTEQDER
jgi:hypothetical protein